MTVTRITVVHPPKVIDLESQELRSSGILKYGAKLVQKSLEPEDILSFESARAIYSIPFVNVAFRYMTEVTAIRTIQLVVNLASVAYQNTFASWFLYMVTTPSGVKKLYECIFENPFYGVLWFLSFYFVTIKGSTDEAKFDKITSFLGMPKHSEMGYGQQFYESLATHVQEKSAELIGMHPEGYSSLLKAVFDALPMIFSKVAVGAGGIVVSKGRTKLNLNHEQDFAKLVKATLETSHVTYDAVYITARDAIDFDSRQIQDQLAFIADKAKLKKIVKSSVLNPKDRRAKKKVLRAISEVRTPEGGKVCLDECKVRVRTYGGGYCEGKCSTTTMWNDKHWCWVDPSKMKHGHTRQTFLGRAYDTCDPSKASKEPVCFTGVSYDKCGVK